MTEESAKISSVQKTSTLPSTNVISHDSDGAEKSGDDALLTKKYVSLIHLLVHGGCRSVMSVKNIFYAILSCFSVLVPCFGFM